MWDSVATLKGEAVVTYDQFLNEIITFQEREVFVQPMSVFASEFYQAAQVGLHPSITLELTNREDYKGEKFLSFGGKDYTIVRADWNAQKDKIRLICEERIGIETEMESE